MTLTLLLQCVLYATDEGVHQMLQQSGELVFINSSGNVDHLHLRVFLIMIYSQEGGLRLDVVMTTNERTATIERALHLYNSLLTPASYFGRGLSGPCAFMTDDSAAERSALCSMYSDAKLLLCAFHVLQAYWCFLWDSHSGVPKADHQCLFNYLKAMVYADSEARLAEVFSAAMATILVFTPLVQEMLECSCGLKAWHPDALMRLGRAL